MAEGKHDGGQSHEVRIHIDREAYESPNPTTGEALYKLGSVAKHRELFREVDGNHEDELIERNADPVHVKQDEHFYSQKAITIIINADPVETTETRLSFEELVKLAFDPVPTGENILITIDYAKGPPANPKGSLLAGQSVKLKNRMVFDVTATDRS